MVPGGVGVGVCVCVPVGIEVCVPILGFDADADADSGLVLISVCELLACITVDSFAAWSGLTIWKDIVAMLIIECLDQ